MVAVSDVIVKDVDLTQLQGVVAKNKNQCRTVRCFFSSTYPPREDGRLHTSHLDGRRTVPQVSARDAHPLARLGHQVYCT